MEDFLEKFPFMLAYAQMSAKIREEMRNPDYVKQETTTNLNGKFVFKDVPRGKYFITAITVDGNPTTKIAMHWVSWQVPVVMEKKI